MASTNQVTAAKRNIEHAQKAAKQKRTLANLLAGTRRDPGSQAAQARQRGGQAGQAERPPDPKPDEPNPPAPPHPDAPQPTAGS
jgi:hypothetical protein